MSDEWFNDFQCPPAEYRPVPFWSWNDRLDPEAVRWQIGEMKKAGLGGYFMHARGGLETDYLGEEWMQCVDAGIEEGLAQGMNPWVYDENGWPSGFASGAVTALGAAYHARGLRLDRGESPAGSVLGYYTWDEATGELFHHGETKPAGVEPDALLVVSQTVGPHYIDVLNPMAVKAFLDATHEKYYERFGRHFGKGLRGFFTDEPRLSEGAAPWSLTLPEKFSVRYGYDILGSLPALFLPCGDWMQVRHDFWSLVSDLFVTSFMKQIYDWCTDHGCELTGHVMMEESVYSQMTGTAGSMPFYEYMHVPGVDWLRRMIGSPVVPKQVGSAAAQMGRRQALTESFALCGWNVNFEELKWIAEWQFVNGVNLVCPHLQGYTLRGLRKRDYPPSLFIQQPWWPDYTRFTDYLARLGVALAEGRPAADILLLHPMHSGWVLYDGTNNDELQKLDADFVRASEALSGLHAQYHYGDETLLRRHGAVEGGMLRVGQCVYRAVVMPSMHTIDESTLTLLMDFSRKGGLIVSAGRFPDTVQGREDFRLDTLKRAALHAADDEALCCALAARALLPLSVRDGGGSELKAIHGCRRELEGSGLLFLVNHSRQESFDAVITVDGIHAVRRLSAEDGGSELLPVTNKGGKTAVALQFAPMQSHLLLLERPGATATAAEPAMTITPGNDWDVEELSPNALTLDICHYRVDGGPWEGPLPVIHLMDRLLSLRRPCGIEMRFLFEADLDLRKNQTLQLALEQAKETEISVNGHAVPNEDRGWWLDTAFRTVDIKPWVRQGRNEITLSRQFFQRQKVYDVLFGQNVYETELNKLTYDTELESVYLVGDFGVVSRSAYAPGGNGSFSTGGPFALADRPVRLRTGDLTGQGLCFFAGRVRLGQDITIGKPGGRRVALDIGRPDAVTARVLMNGRPVKVITWAPFTADVTDFVHEGVNRLFVELASGNRNLLGPHHHTAGEPYNVGPLSFTGKWSWCERPTEAVAIDDRDRTRSYWQDAWSFVPFGLRSQAEKKPMNSGFQA